MADVAETLAARVRLRDDGGAFVQTLGNLGEGAIMAAPASPLFYDGTLGVALALASAARALGRDELARLARALLLPVRRTLASRHGEQLLQSIEPGFGQGLAGFISGLDRCGEVLEDAAVRGEARGLARFSDAVLARDTMRDLMGGATGLGLALLRLGEVEGARRCGHSLLRAARDAGGHGLSWPVNGGPGLAGLSHGGAGMALLFAGLLRADGDGGWRRGLDGALAYEASLFDPTAGNWRDLRASASGFMTSWCHGAPGIALSRHGILAQLGEDPGGCVDDLERAIASTAGQVSGRDDLCCGCCGRAVILCELGRRMERPALVERAGAMLDGVLTRAGRRGEFGFWHAGTPITTGDLSLFKGLSGVCYALARQVEPAIPLALLP